MGMHAEIYDTAGSSWVTRTSTRFKNQMVYANGAASNYSLHIGDGARTYQPREPSSNQNRYVSAAAYLGGGWSGCTAFVSSAPPPSPVVAPRSRARLPPLRGTSLRPRQHRPHEPPIRRRQPLIEEDATVASCPVCLYSYDDVEARRQPSMATVQWTACCGQHFHSSCISKLTRCPMCRSDLGVGIGREWRAVRLSAPVLLRAELRLLKSEAAAQPS